MKEKYINHCKSRLFKKNIFPANVGHLSIQIKIRVKNVTFVGVIYDFPFFCENKIIKIIQYNKVDLLKMKIDFF